jgi:hypothetical protein
LLFMQQSTDTIYRTDLTGAINGSRTIGSITYNPGGNTTIKALHTTSVASDGSNYYFSDYTNNSGGYDLYSIGKASGSAATISSEIAAYGGYPIDVRDGMLYRTEPSTSYSWSDLDQIRVSTIGAPDSISQTLNLLGGNGIGDIAVDSDRNNIWTIDYSGSASLNRFDLATGALLDNFGLSLDGLTGGLTYANDKLYHYDWDSVQGSTLSVYALSDSSAVPVPAAVWLFGTALMGLVGLSKRRKAS